MNGKESLEIERKFLVNSFDPSLASKSFRIVQGYITAEKTKTVRVRIKGQKGFITIKGQSSDDGLSRFEWEKEIPVSEVEALLKLCEPGLIDKTRYEIPVGNHIYEVDIFEGDNKGLIVAEVELSSTDETFKKPDWLGQEVTGDNKYYNAMLMKTPFNKW
ncbi:CYTH domain-containing protein [Flammeovirga kamogawensis]|uniref:CYTH domain-containing protein n=1 Tax=Flammeovirga kamogawensis TaxID=373891 RepID=A0ABX8GR34_9BACT|nr:CYTH domain-containing protein [Flammeovirga kamogawensis]MBB6463175.1 CYTH domain-containing protein [Flammeovirga kamogawensis]QWG05971.1 CYTH domain-containing protein [Flammeovirga kamogawensis]TRX67798.1 CYTH domain-containing protein [Flammeovirga kamogawensis]